MKIIDLKEILNNLPKKFDDCEFVFRKVSSNSTPENWESEDESICTLERWKNFLFL